MRQERIYSGTVTAGQTVTHTIARGHLNGLLFVGAAVAAGSITVKRRTDAGCAVLAANLGLNHAARISDLERGATAGNNVLELIREVLVTTPGVNAALTAAEWKASVLDSVGPQDLPSWFFNLGSIYLGQDSDLELEVTFTGAGEARIYSVGLVKSPDMMLQYDQISDREGTHTKVDAIFLSSTSGFLVTPDADGLYSAIKDVSLQVEDSDGAYLTDVGGLVAGATVLSRTENIVQNLAVQAYAAPQGIPADVFLRLSGADVSDVALIARKAVFDQRAVSKNTVLEMRKLAARVEALEKSDPVTAKALRHAGIVDKSSEIARAVAAAEKPA